MNGKIKEYICLGLDEPCLEFVRGFPVGERTAEIRKAIYKELLSRQGLGQVRQGRPPKVYIEEE